MSLPLSFEVAINKSLKAAQGFRRANLDVGNPMHRAELEVDIGRLIADLAFLMDKIMNLIYEKHGDKKGNKPNIYFPASATRSKFEDRLRSARLASLPDQQPELFALIESVQPYASAKLGWWPTLQSLASKRHEEFTPIEARMQEAGIYGGRGQDGTLSFSIDGGRVRFWDVKMTNQRTGMPEPLRVEYLAGVTAAIRGLSDDPFEFIILCCEEMKALMKKIGLHL